METEHKQINKREKMGKVQTRKFAPVTMHTDFSFQGEICIDAPRDEVRPSLLCLMNSDICHSFLSLLLQFRILCI